MKSQIMLSFSDITSTFRPAAIFVINTQNAFHSKSVYMIMTHLQINIYTSFFSASLLITFKTKVKYRFRTVAMLFYITQEDITLTKLVSRISITVKNFRTIYLVVLVTPPAQKFARSPCCTQDVRLKFHENPSTSSKVTTGRRAHR